VPSGTAVARKKNQQTSRYALWRFANVSFCTQPRLNLMESGEWLFIKHPSVFQWFGYLFKSETELNMSVERWWTTQ